VYPSTAPREKTLLKIGLSPLDPNLKFIQFSAIKYNNAMKQITITGTIANAAGIALSVIIAQGSTILSTHHYFAPFSASFQLAAGSNCTITINGFTQGQFTFDIQGASTVNPVANKTYNQSVADVFIVTA
jgi:hypothetical protein